MCPDSETPSDTKVDAEVDSEIDAEVSVETSAEPDVETDVEAGSDNSESVASQASNDDSSAAMPLNVAPLDAARIKNITEAALMAAGQPLSLDRLLNLFMDENQPSREELRTALELLSEECACRGIELVEVGSGFRYQAKQENAEWVARLWEEKPARYSRALLETLSLIAYRQPITRGEIEDIRGVSVSTNIMKTLMERDWVKVVGHRDVPGKPAMYASTKQFLDYFSLKTLSDLPTLAEIRDIDSINAELDLKEPGSEHADGSGHADGSEHADGNESEKDATTAEMNFDVNVDAKTDDGAAQLGDESDIDDVAGEENATEINDSSELSADEQDEEQDAVTTANPA